MKRLGHIGLGLIFTTPIALIPAILQMELLLSYVIFTGIIFAIMPDWDKKTCRIRHNLITHTIWFALLVTILHTGIITYLQLTYHIFPQNTLIIATTVFLTSFFAILSHLLGDALIPWGVRPLFPYNEVEYTFNLTSEKSTAWNLGLFVLGLLTITAPLFLVVS